MTLFDWGDIASPFTVDGIKVWPCQSRPGFQWFIAYQLKPHYFRSKSEALRFIATVTSSEA
jgi:hypothetical protein